jgi:hypothetical protein
MKYKIYCHHKGLGPDRFDTNFTVELQKELANSKNAEVEVVLNTSEFTFYMNDGDVFKIPHGSVRIIENVDTKQFYVYDFGDDCAHVFPLIDFKNFAGMALGQFNRHKINQLVPENKRHLVRPGIYPESDWNFGVKYFDQIQRNRKNNPLDPRLHFRGTVYPNLRDSVYVLQRKYSNDVFMGTSRVTFNDYLNETTRFKLTLGMGLSPYSSDLCPRDLDMFGIGVPILRPKLYVEVDEPLIPDVHYVSCDVPLDPFTLWVDDHEKTADIMYQRYQEVIDNDEFLDYISRNAREWYLRNTANNTPVQRLVRWINI